MFGSNTFDTARQSTGRFFGLPGRKAVTSASVQSRTSVQATQAPLTIARQDLPGSTITLMALRGDLGPSTYLEVIRQAQADHEQGRTHLVIDLTHTKGLGISSIFALHNVARIFNGQPAGDPEHGLPGLRRLLEEVKPAAEQRVRLLNPSPAMQDMLAASDGMSLLPVAANLADACTALSATL